MIGLWPLLLVAALSVFLGACASSLPGPPRIIHPPNAYEEVPYPPPAALVEVVPSFPGSPAVWLDGYWTWQGKFYLWRRGGWVDVPHGSYFAEWQSYYTADGRLMFARGAWYQSDRSRVRGPAIRRSASSLPNEAVSELQTAH
jgi:hypothetical protein